MRKAILCTEEERERLAKDRKECATLLNLLCRRNLESAESLKRLERQEEAMAIAAATMPAGLADKVTGTAQRLETSI